MKEELNQIGFGLSHDHAATLLVRIPPVFLLFLK